MYPYFAAGAESVFNAVLKLLGPIIGLLVGWFWGQWQANSAWKKKKFTNRTVLSLNVIDLYDAPAEGAPVGALKLRTLFERDLSDVFHNQAMESMVKEAAKATAPGDPILRFPKDDVWFILNSILNQIAEQFAVGTLKADMGGDVAKTWYTFCVTFEHEERMHQFKPRILLMQRDTFLSFPDTGEFDLETPHHEVRVETLRLLKAERQKNPHLFMDLELTL